MTWKWYDGGMDTKEPRPGFTIDVLVKLMERVEASITGINSKASILFYLNGFLLTNLVLQWPRFFGLLRGHAASTGLVATAMGTMGVAVLGIMISLWLSYSAILPGNVRLGKVEGPLSLVFFAHIASRDADAYWREVESCPEPALREDFARQVHSLSTIVHIKQRRMRLAVEAAMFLSIPGLVVLMGLYLLRAG